MTDKDKAYTPFKDLFDMFKEVTDVTLSRHELLSRQDLTPFFNCLQSLAAFEQLNSSSPTPSTYEPAVMHLIATSAREMKARKIVEDTSITISKKRARPTTPTSEGKTEGEDKPKPKTKAKPKPTPPPIPPPPKVAPPPKPGLFKNKKQPTGPLDEVEVEVFTQDPADVGLGLRGGCEMR